MKPNGTRCDVRSTLANYTYVCDEPLFQPTEGGALLHLVLQSTQGGANEQGKRVTTSDRFPLPAGREKASDWQHPFAFEWRLGSQGMMPASRLDSERGNVARTNTTGECDSEDTELMNRTRRVAYGLQLKQRALS